MFLLETPKEKKIKAQISELKQQLIECQQRRTITCPHCNKKTPLADATVITLNSYVPPRGCTEGDYYTFSEYLYYCNKCDGYERAYVGSFDKDWDTKEIHPEKLKLPRVCLFLFIEKFHHYFGEKLELYGEEERRSLTIDDIREINKKRKQNQYY